jgi:hypothetical protein
MRCRKVRNELVFMCLIAGISGTPIKRAERLIRRDGNCLKLLSKRLISDKAPQKSIGLSEGYQV